MTMAPEHESVTTSGGTRLSYSDTGNPKGVPVVLIHAFPFHKEMWDAQVEALQKIARVLTFDIRGLGKTDSNSPYTLEFVVDDLIALLDQLHIDKVVVCGLSMGGYVALRALERNPERFMGAILANTKSEADSDKAKLGRHSALKAIQEQGLAAFTESFLKSSLAPSTTTEQPHVFERAKKLILSSSAVGVSAAILALVSRTDTTASLNQIRVPTLILHGESDTVIPLEAAKSLHEKIKGSTFFIIPKAGHLSHFENPEVFNEQLVQFIKKFPMTKTTL